MMSKCHNPNDQNFSTLPTSTAGYFAVTCCRSSPCTSFSLLCTLGLYHRTLSFYILLVMDARNSARNALVDPRGHVHVDELFHAALKLSRSQFPNEANDPGLLRDGSGSGAPYSSAKRGIIKVRCSHWKDACTVCFVNGLASFLLDKKPKLDSCPINQNLK